MSEAVKTLGGFIDVLEEDLRSITLIHEAIAGAEAVLRSYKDLQHNRLQIAKTMGTEAIGIPREDNVGSNNTTKGEK